MELRQLRYLVALAEEQSFTRAASKVLVAQPALSQQVAKLEADLAVREDLSVSLAAQLRADELDLAFITIPAGPATEGLDRRLVSSEDMVAVLPPDHELSRRRKLRITDLA